MLKVMRLIVWVGVFWLGATAQADTIDAPHNLANGIACGDCHSYNLWWQYSPSEQNPAPDKPTIVATVCLKCHSETGTAPFVQTHSADVIGSVTYHQGNWGIGCTDCHNPHHQEQLVWAGSTDTPFLVTGMIDSVSVDTPAVGQTTINYSIISSNLNWPSVGASATSLDWTNKSKAFPDRSLILVQDVYNAVNSFSIISATSTEVVVQGILDPSKNYPMTCPGAGFDCQTLSSTFGLIYGQLIRSEINTPNSGTKSVKFFDPNGGFVDTANFDGICQVCHTQTNHYQNGDDAAWPGNGLSHASAGHEDRVCTDCHKHIDGFKGSGHDNTHFAYEMINGLDCAICHADPDNKGIVDAVHGGKCGLCHTSPSGGDALIAGSTLNGVDGDAVGEDKNTFNSTCANCHDSALKAVNTVPDMHHLESPNNYALLGDCTQCHMDAAGNGKLAADHTALIHDDTNTCSSNGCHAANVGTVLGAAIDPNISTIHDGCTTCHKKDGSLRAAYGRAPAMPDGGPGTDNGGGHCSSCHTDKTGGHAIDHVSTGRVFLPATGSCSGCHDATVDTALFVDPQNNAVHDSCATCHTDPSANDYSLRNDTGRRLDPGDCTSCHSDKDDGITLNLFAHQIDHVQTNRVTLFSECAGCHDVTVTSPFIDDTNNKKHDACTTCHVSQTNLGLVLEAMDAQGGGGTCDTCHTAYFDSHNYGTAHTKVSQRPAIDLSVGTPCSGCHLKDSDLSGVSLDSWTDIKDLHDTDGTAGNSSCFTCHTSDRQAVKDTIASGQAGNSVGCLDCHADRAVDHSDHIVMGVVTAETTCVSCHDRDSVATSAFYIGQIHNGNCANCHTNPAIGDYSLTGSATGHGRDVVGFDPVLNPNTCATCHTPIAASFLAHPKADDHTGQVVPTADCVACHKHQGDVIYDVHNFNCGNCHVGGTGVLKSVAANGPGECLDCHGDFYNHPNTVDHSLLVKATERCVSCHDQQDLINGVHQPGTCTNCHTATGALIPPAVSGGGECATCHTGIADSFFSHPKANDHTGQVAVKATCAACHGGEPITDIHKNKCENCHTPVTGILWNGAENGPGDCAKCHAARDTNWYSHNFDHEAQGRISLTAECQSCHTETLVAGQAFVNSSDGKRHDACSVCHNTDGSLNADAAAAVGGNAECATCHVDYFALHTYGNAHTGTAMRATDLAAGTPCANCHGSNLTDWSGIKSLHDVDTNGAGPCATCHQSPRTEVSAAISQGQTGVAIGCLNCHPTRSADHADHIVMGVVTGEASCLACHDENSVGTSIYYLTSIHPGCTTCHTDPAAKDYSLRSFAAGHGRTDAGFGNPNTCATCHAARAADWTSHNFDHEAQNRIALHDDCKGCHDETLVAGQAFVDAANGKKHDACTVCHNTDGSLNADAINAINGNADCTTCHLAYFDNHNYGLNHLGTALRGTDLSNGTSCSVCHGSDSDQSGTVLDSWVDVKALHSVDTNGAGPCLTCHKSSRPDVVAAIAGQVANVGCLSCHPGRVSEHSDHIFMGVVTGEGSCLVCHDEANVGTSSFYLTTIHTNSCATCHLDVANNDFTLISRAAGHGRSDSGFGNPNTCATCHDDRAADWTTHNFDHEAKSRIALHVDCQECHATTLTAGQAFVDPLDGKKHDACTVCHNTDGTLNNDAILAIGGNADCTTCHDAYFNSHNYGSAHLNTALRATDLSIGASCANCHGGSLVTWLEVRAVHDVATNGAGACATCHQSGRLDVKAAIVNGQAGAAIGCLDCHQDRALDHADHIAMGVLTGYSSCLACHDTANVGTSDFYLNSIHSGCATCHNDPTNNDYSLNGSAFGHGRVDAGFGNPNTCATCHAPRAADWTSHVFDHEAQNRISLPVSCQPCHNGTLTPGQAFVSASDNFKHDACTVCHNANGSIKTSLTAAIGGGADCTTCHAISHDMDVDHDQVVGTPSCVACHGETVSTGGTADVDPNGTYIEAETYTALGDNWQLASTVSGANGGQYLNAVANNMTSPLGQPVEFTVNFVQTGTYFISFRGQDQGSSGNNSLWYGVDSVMVGNATTSATSTNWTWTNTPHDSGPNPTAISITTFGEHTITVWAREDGFNLDGFYLAHQDPALPTSAIPQGALILDPNDNNAGTTTGFNLLGLHLDDCLTCHTSSLPDVISTIAAGKAGTQVKCVSCHTGPVSGATVHGTDVLTAAPLHQMFVADASCQSCHDIDTAEKRLLVHTDCLICHGSSKQDVIDAITDGKNGITVNCSTCHNGGPDSAITHGLDFASAAANHDRLLASASCLGCHVIDTAEERLSLHQDCVTCHDSTKADVVATIAAGKSGTDVNCLSCHNGTSGSALSHGLTPAEAAVDHNMFAADTNCQGCHDINTAEKRIALHSDCFTCHSSTQSDVIAAINTGKSGSSVNCGTCHNGTSGGATTHGTTPATAAPVHDNLQTTTPCLNCHQSDTSEERLLLHNTCLTCHGSTTQAVQDAINAGQLGTTINCKTCHGLEVAAAHHAGVNAKNGNCAYCHVDSRPWDTAPQQMACRECHLDNNGYVVTTRPTSPSHSINTNGAIQNFGACFACHQVTPFHAKPASAPNDCRDARDYPGRGSFNLFYNQYNQEPSGDNGPSESCKNERGDYRNPAINYNMATLNIAGVSYNVPHFDGQNVVMPVAQHNRVSAAAECASCHGNSNIIPNVHNNNCLGCHMSQSSAIQAVINDARNGANVNCLDCHGAIAANNHDAPIVHNNLHVGGTCSNCHNVGSGSFDDIYTLHQSDCMKCHGSASSTVQNAIDSGKAGTSVDCTTCHGSEIATVHHNTSNAKSGNCTYCHIDSRPWNDAPQQMACRECHLDNNGYVQTSSPAPSHAWNTNGAIQNFGACFACHQVTPFHAKPTSAPNDCRDARNYPGRGSFNLFYNQYNQEPSGDNGPSESCKSDRGDFRNPAINYDMATLNIAGASYDVPHFDGHDTVMPVASHSRISAVASCSSCHATSNIISATHNDNCLGCHMSQDAAIQAVITDARNGANIDCGNCHTAIVANNHDAQAVHDNLNAGGICLNCHDVGNGTFDDIYALHLNDCMKCHGSSSSTVQTAIDSGKAGSYVDCTSCHGSETAAVHHNNSQAKAGNCGACHIDPRPAIWSGAPTGQLACRECHINNNGYVQTSSPAPSHAWNTNGSIQNFGVCFACHSPNPYHAKPSSLQNCTGNPGQGTFNIFQADLGGDRGSRRSGGNSCRNNEGRYDTPGISFNCESISSFSSRVYGQAKDGMVPTFENGDGNCPSSWWSGGSGGGGGGMGR